MDFKAAVKTKYSYMKDEEIELLVKRAQSICIDKLYPGDMSVNYTTFNWDNPRFEMWILDCVDELVERAGMSSVVAYKENGMSWSFDRAGVSQALLDRLPSLAHTITGD